MDDRLAGRPIKNEPLDEEYESQESQFFLSRTIKEEPIDTLPSEEEITEEQFSGYNICNFDDGSVYQRDGNYQSIAENYLNHQVDYSNYQYTGITSTINGNNIKSEPVDVEESSLFDQNHYEPTVQGHDWALSSDQSEYTSLGNVFEEEMLKNTTKSPSAISFDVFNGQSIRSSGPQRTRVPVTFGSVNAAAHGNIGQVRTYRHYYANSVSHHNMTPYGNRGTKGPKGKSQIRDLVPQTYNEEQPFYAYSAEELGYDLGRTSFGNITSATIDAAIMEANTAATSAKYAHERAELLMKRAKKAKSIATKKEKVILAAAKKVYEMRKEVYENSTSASSVISTSVNDITVVQDNTMVGDNHTFLKMSDEVNILTHSGDGVTVSAFVSDTTQEDDGHTTQEDEVMPTSVVKNNIMVGDNYTILNMPGVKSNIHTHSGDSVTVSAIVSDTTQEDEGRSKFSMNYQCQMSNFDIGDSTL